MRNGAKLRATVAEQQEQDTLVWSDQAEYDGLRNITPESPCPYLPERLARNEAYLVESMDADEHDVFMSLGFRRSGCVIYRPRCRKCRACLSLRVLVDRFSPGRSLRRVARRGRDVRMEVGEPAPTEEKFALFLRYLDGQHDDTMTRTWESFADFLYGSPTETLEFCYRLQDRLIGVGIADRCSTGLSSVYMYFDPACAALSPGTLSALREVGYCSDQGLPYYYLGYFVAGCGKMDYKARFRPNEILLDAGTWVPFRE
jgi:arginyl-tRNA--protein-N-Asp/Glu arginylyltransferase